MASAFAELDAIDSEREQASRFADLDAIDAERAKPQAFADLDAIDAERAKPSSGLLAQAGAGIAQHLGDVLKGQANPTAIDFANPLTQPLALAAQIPGVKRVMERAGEALTDRANAVPAPQGVLQGGARMGGGMLIPIASMGATMAPAMSGEALREAQQEGASPAQTTLRQVSGQVVGGALALVPNAGNFVRSVGPAARTALNIGGQAAAGAAGEVALNAVAGRPLLENVEDATTQQAIFSAGLEALGAGLRGVRGLRMPQQPSAQPIQGNGARAAGPETAGTGAAEIPVRPDPAPDLSSAPPEPVRPGQESPVEPTDAVSPPRPQTVEAAGPTTPPEAANDTRPAAAEDLRSLGPALGARVVETQKAKDSAYSDFMRDAVQRDVDAQRGQQILESLQEQGASVQDVTRRFWSQTYPNLPSETQVKFQKYILKSNGGLKPGDEVAQNTNTGEWIRAQDWSDPYLLDLPKEIDALEGTDRGLVALMSAANDLLAAKPELPTTGTQRPAEILPLETSSGTITGSNVEQAAEMPVRAEGVASAPEPQKPSSPPSTQPEAPAYKPPRIARADQPVVDAVLDPQSRALVKDLSKLPGRTLNYLARELGLEAKARSRKALVAEIHAAQPVATAGRHVMARTDIDALVRKHGLRGQLEELQREISDIARQVRTGVIDYGRSMRKIGDQNSAGQWDETRWENAGSVYPGGMNKDTVPALQRFLAGEPMSGKQLAHVQRAINHLTRDWPKEAWEGVTRPEEFPAPRATEEVFREYVAEGRVLPHDADVWLDLNAKTEAINSRGESIDVPVNDNTYRIVTHIPVRDEAGNVTGFDYLVTDDNKTFLRVGEDAILKGEADETTLKTFFDQFTQPPRASEADAGAPAAVQRPAGEVPQIGSPGERSLRPGNRGDEPETLTLQSETRDQRAAREKAAADKAEIARRQNERKTGNAGDLGTGDMFDKTAGENALFTQQNALPETGTQRPADFQQVEEGGRGQNLADPGAPIAPASTPPPPPGATMMFDARMPVSLQPAAQGAVTVPQIMSQLEKVMTTAGLAGPIREGRFRERARGIFKTQPEVVRLESIDNIPTAAHEVWHGLQQAVYGTANSAGLKGLSPAVRNELIAMGKALYGSRKPVAGYTSEGGSEFLRYWLTYPQGAKQIAPEMTRFFENTFLPAHPEIARELNKARDLIAIWGGQGAEARARAQIMREPGRVARIGKALKDFFSYSAQLESGQPLQELSREATRKLGRELKPSEDPFKLFTMKRGTSGAIIERMVFDNMVDPWGNPSGPPLAEALAPVKGQREPFMLYLFARRAIERWGKGINPGIALEDAQYIKALHDKPEFQLAADKYYRWWDGVLDYVVKADPTMTDMVNNIRGGSTDYAPLARMVDPRKAKSFAVSAASNPFKAMRGSGLPVKDIFESTFQAASKLVNRANRSLVSNAIVKLSNIDGMGHVLEEVPRERVQKTFSIETIRRELESMGVDTSPIPDDQLFDIYTPAEQPKGSAPIISVRQGDGTTRWFQVKPELYDALGGLQAFDLKSIPTLGPILDVFVGMPARAFRLGTTGLRPSFSLITNPLRDVQTWLLQTQAGGNPAKQLHAYFDSALRGISARLGGGKDPYSEAFLNLGANMGQPLGLDIGHTRRVAKELFHGKLMRVVSNPVDHLRELLSIPESVPRVAEMKLLAKEIGWQPGQPLSPDQAVMLANAAKRATVDFSAAGRVSRVLNQAIPFYNPAVQGMRSFARAYRDNPVRTTLLGLSMLTVPTLMNWWRNKDEEWYQALPWREKFAFTNVQDGRDVWQIPRSFEFGTVFQVVPEALVDSWYRKDPEGVKQALGYMFDVVNPADMPVLARIAKEQWANRIDFWDKPIVPRNEIDLPAAEQVGPYTSDVAKGIAKVFPTISPRRVDAAVRGYFGGALPDLLDALGVGAQKSPVDDASQYPVIGKLWRRGGQFSGQNQRVQDYWDRNNEIQARANQLRRRIAEVQKGERPASALEDMDPRLRAIASRENRVAEQISLLMKTAAGTTNAALRAELYQQASRIADQEIKWIDANVPKP